MKKVLLAIPFSIVLVGCQIPNVQLPQLPTVEQNATASTGIVIPAKKGQPLDLTVAVPAGTCDQKAYLVGVETGYISHWNTSIQDRAFMVHLAHKNTPNSTTRYNNDLYYKAPVYSTTNTANANQEYGNFAKTESGKLSPCTYRSFTAGKTKGQTIAQNDYLALQSKER